MDTRNVYLYWTGKQYKLISILRNLIYLHSKNGKGYNVNLITTRNIRNYIQDQDLPYYFNKLKPAHQADFIRVNVICDNGGIWLDSDTIVMESLDSLFDIIENNDGFFIKENNEHLWNGIFGSKKQTPLMQIWKTKMREILDAKYDKIHWTEIGNELLETIYNSNTNLYNNYKIFNGLDNLYPVNYDNCVSEYIDNPYDNYKNIIREYQPLLVLVNEVYKNLEIKTKEEILNSNLPLNYFINKSIDNAGITVDQLINEDFYKIEMIPKVIYMCHKNLDHITIYSQNWKKLNPEWEIKLYDNELCKKFLLEEYSQLYVDIFNFIPDGPIKADFWRICIVNKYGGLYVDADIEPLVPLSEYIDSDVHFVTCISSNFKKCVPEFGFNPHFIMSYPNNDILQDCINKYIYLYNKKMEYSYWGWSITKLFNIVNVQYRRSHHHYDRYGRKYQLLYEVNYERCVFIGKTVLNNRYEFYKEHNFIE